MEVKFKYNDGGRKAAGFEGGVADCVTRALAIETGVPYAEIRKELLALAPDAETVGINVFGAEFEQYMRDKRNRVFVPLRYAVRLADFPEFYGFMVLTKNHVTCVQTGVVEDVFDCSNEMARGYWVVGDNLFDVINYDGVKLNKNGALSLAQAVKMRDLLYLNYNTKSWII